MQTGQALLILACSAFILIGVALLVMWRRRRR
jgi:hypothetical protein